MKIHSIESMKSKHVVQWNVYLLWHISYQTTRHKDVQETNKRLQEIVLTRNYSQSSKWRSHQPK